MERVEEGAVRMTVGWKKTGGGAGPPCREPSRPASILHEKICHAQGEWRKKPSPVIPSELKTPYQHESNTHTIVGNLGFSTENLALFFRLSHAVGQGLRPGHFKQSRPFHPMNHQTAMELLKKREANGGRPNIPVAL